MQKTQFFLVSFFMCFLGIASFGQNERTDLQTINYRIDSLLGLESILSDAEFDKKIFEVSSEKQKIEKHLIFAEYLRFQGRYEDALNELNNLIYLVSFNQYPQYLAKLWLIKGRILGEQNELLISLRAYLKAKEILDCIPEEIEELARLQTLIGGLYYNLSEYESAENCFKDSYQVGVENSDTLLILRSLFNISDVLISKNNIQEAHNYLILGKKLSANFNSKLYKVLLESNLAYCKCISNDYDGAQQLFEQSQNFLDSLKSPRYSSQVLFRKFDCEVFHQNILNSRSHLETLDSISLFLTNETFKVRKLQAEVRLLELEGKYKEANEKHSVLKNLMSEFNIASQIKQIVTEEQRYQRKQELKLVEAESEIEAEKLKRNRLLLSIIIGIILIVLGYIIVYTKRKNTKLQIALLEQKENLQKIRQKMETKLEMESELKKSKLENDSRSKLFQLAQTKILTEEDWIQFKHAFNTVYSGFFASLQDDIAENLTESEKRLVSLEKLGFSNQEIAGILGISPESVSKTRYRFKKN